jgi:hypothetical protein
LRAKDLEYWKTVYKTAFDIPGLPKGITANVEELPADERVGWKERERTKKDTHFTGKEASKY